MSSTTTYITTGLLAAIAGGAVVYFLASKANDDDPIIMAGGSLHVYTHSAKFKKNGKGVVHGDSKKYVTGVDVIAGNPLALTSIPFTSRQVQIDMPYCADDACTSTDTVTFQTDNNGQGLSLSDQNGAIGGELNGNEVAHQPEAGHIQQITVAGKTYTCDKGRCFLLIHYCSNANCK